MKNQHILTTRLPDSLTTDLVTLVNESDEVIGSMDKIEAHRGEGHLHRAVSVYLFRPIRHPEPDNEFLANSKEEKSSHSRSTSKQGGLNPKVELLIQQRSAKKIVGAHQWANTVCGNVRPTETYEECAYRRLREELGITKVEIKEVYDFQYHLQCNEEFSEYEIDHVFIGSYDGEVLPNPDEAQDFTWVKWGELAAGDQWSVISKDKYSATTIKLTTKNQLKIPPMTEQLTTTLAPWFVWMLGDRKLVQIITTTIS